MYELTPLTSFVPVTSTNVGISSQNFLTFGFNPFATLVWNFKFVPSDSFKLFNLNQEHPSPKKCGKTDLRYNLNQLIKSYLWAVPKMPILNRVKGALFSLLELNEENAQSLVLVL